MRISGYKAPLTIGQSATLTCSSDLNVNSVIWYYDGEVVGSYSGSQAVLDFDLVDDSIHGRQYTCTVKTSQERLDQSITISVEGWLELSMIASVPAPSSTSILLFGKLYYIPNSNITIGKAFNL